MKDYNSLGELDGEFFIYYLVILMFLLAIVAIVFFASIYF